MRLALFLGVMDAFFHGSIDRSFDWLIDWLILGWLIDWLIDSWLIDSWLIDWLILGWLIDWGKILSICVVLTVFLLKGFWNSKWVGWIATMEAGDPIGDGIFALGHGQGISRHPQLRACGKWNCFVMGLRNESRGTRPWSALVLSTFSNNFLLSTLWFHFAYREEEKISFFF